jgi:hypothetical protein
MIRRCYLAVGALLVVASLAPVLIQLFAAAVPLLVVAGATVIIARLVWFYTNRY